MLVIGSNTTEAHPVLALRIKKAVRNGATLVVADPRAIWLTKLAKRHLQLRPGSDVWLLNAIMHVILEEGLQDDAYIAPTAKTSSRCARSSRYTPGGPARHRSLRRGDPRTARSTRPNGTPRSSTRWDH
jgi:predicted molibdopterin-dependent oxidoreductase YjgC